MRRDIDREDIQKALFTVSKRLGNNFGHSESSLWAHYECKNRIELIDVNVQQGLSAPY